MPIHDWPRVPSGLFHDFHQSWSIRIKDALNAGRLPEGIAALVEQRAGRSHRDIYAARANRIVLRHHLGRIIAVLEIVSPGNKNSRPALRELVGKTLEFIRAGIHVLTVDLFPPTPRDPQGIHGLVWDELADESFTFPAGADRLLASYEASEQPAAYLEPLGLGDPMPDMPIFLTSPLHAQVPLESTYNETWQAAPAALRNAVQSGKLPDADNGSPAEQH